MLSNFGNIAKCHPGVFFHSSLSGEACERHLQSIDRKTIELPSYSSINVEDCPNQKLVVLVDQFMVSVNVCLPCDAVTNVVKVIWWRCKGIIIKETEIFIL